MGKTNFDERQLRIRGDIFKHGFILIIGLILIHAFLLSNDIIWAEASWASILLMFFAVTVCSVEMIIRDVYTGIGKRTDIMLYLMGALSLVLIVLLIIHIIRGEFVFWNGILVEDGVNTVFAIFISTIFLAFLFKKRLDKRNDGE